MAVAQEIETLMAHGQLRRRGAVWAPHSATSAKLWGSACGSWRAAPWRGTGVGGRMCRWQTVPCQSCPLRSPAFWRGAS